MRLYNYTYTYCNIYKTHSTVFLLDQHSTHLRPGPSSARGASVAGTTSSAGNAPAHLPPLQAYQVQRCKKTAHTLFAAFTIWFEKVQSTPMWACLHIMTQLSFPTFLANNCAHQGICSIVCSLNVLSPCPKCHIDGMLNDSTLVV